MSIRKINLAHVIKNYKLLFIILLISSALRLWDLGEVPPHLRNDEVSFGYNAYSILQTGKDEHGELLPILFKSFGDWKPGIYFYLTVPIVAVFGLNEWAVRLPAALSGIMGIYLLYLLTKILFKTEVIALAAAFSLAISPWHIAFSRGAWDAQVSITLTVAGLIFLIKAVDKNSKTLLASAGLFGLSLLTSHGAKPIIPLLLLSFFIAYRKNLSKIPLKILLLSLLIFLTLTIPILSSFLNGKNTRISSLLFLNNYQEVNVPIIARDLFTNWTSHYSLSSLFIRGDGNPQHTAADFGAFMTIDVLFLFLGLKTLARQKIVAREVKLFLLALMILTPLSSALTKEGVNFERFLMFLLTLNIIIGLGINYLFKKFAWKIILPFYGISFLLFMDAYFIHNPAKNDAWQYGYKEIVRFISPIQHRYQKIYFPQGSDQPYIFFLFYQKYPPEKFQNISSSVTIPNGSGWGVDYVFRLENIEFINLNNFPSSFNQPTLLMLPANTNYEYAKSLKIIHEVKDPIGLTVFKLAEFDPR